MQGPEFFLLDLLDQLGPMDLLDLLDRPEVGLAGVAAGLALAELVGIQSHVETGILVQSQ